MRVLPHRLVRHLQLLQLEARRLRAVLASAAALPGLRELYGGRITKIVQGWPKLLAQICETWPYNLTEKVPIRALKLAQNLGQPCTTFVLMGSAVEHGARWANGRRKGTHGVLALGRRPLGAGALG